MYVQCATEEQAKQLRTIDWNAAFIGVVTGKGVFPKVIYIRENSKYTHLFNRNSKYTHEFSKTPKIPNTIYCKGDVIVFIVSQMHRVLENAQCITTVGNHQRITEK